MQQVPVAQSSTSSSTRRRTAKIPAVVDTPKSPYAPGAVRASTDEELARLRNFTAQHPEFADRLGYEGLKQVAATYRDDEDHRVRAEVHAAGVPEEWHRVESDDVAPRWSDDQ